MTEGTSELPQIPPFKDGVVIESTDHYDLVYGYKPGMEGQPSGQRAYLVPKSREAETRLVGFATENKNMLASRPFGEKETIQAVSFSGPADLLASLLRKPEERRAGMISPQDPEQAEVILHAGVPSLKKLEKGLPLPPLKPAAA